MSERSTGHLQAACGAGLPEAGQPLRIFSRAANHAPRRPSPRRISMWIKRQAIKLKVLRMKKEELSPAAHEAARNESARRMLKSLRLLSSDVMDRSLLFFALAVVA